MKKLILALSAGTGVVAASIGLAAPAVAVPPAGAPAQDTVASVAANRADYPQDPCTVHVDYQGALVDVHWC